MRTYEVRTEDGTLALVTADNSEHAKRLALNTLGARITDCVRGANTNFIKTPNVYVRSTPFEEDY